MILDKIKNNQNIYENFMNFLFEAENRYTVSDRKKDNEKLGFNCWLLIEKFINVLYTSTIFFKIKLVKNI